MVFAAPFFFGLLWKRHHNKVNKHPVWIDREFKQLKKEIMRKFRKLVTRCYSLCLVITVLDQSLCRLHIFAGFFAVHFYYKLIVLTVGDIPSPLTVYCLVILFIFLQTIYRGRAGHSTCTDYCKSLKQNISPFRRERSDLRQLSFITHQVK